MDGKCLHFSTKQWIDNAQWRSRNNFHYYFNSLYSEECSSKSGVNSGSCASGFGVCCTCNSFCFYPYLVFSKKLFSQLLLSQIWALISPLPNQNT